ncbi:MAG: acyl-CoA reductase [Oscillospiraceae bacterium]|nr:acyl-CoA reductase [Oscillospiraceae bacterium]
MNLADGKILSQRECGAVLDELQARVAATLKKPALLPETVIAACDRLVKELDEEYFLRRLGELGIYDEMSRSYLAQAREAFCAEALWERLRLELGEDRKNIRPLGTLFHIAAGNADGLPVFSVLEGLLAGNINILKLPSAEGGLSAELLLRLIEAEPILAEYIYVFDYSSDDLVNIARLIAAADAVVVWGGDGAVSALRRAAPPNTRIIEWGHKVSFGYVTPGGLTDDKLRGLARNIAETGQLLCSSCQGIFVDTDDLSEVHTFCERFLPILEAETAKIPRCAEVGYLSALTLELYTAELEAPLTGSRVFRGKGCGLIAKPGGAAEAAPATGAPWVKPLPREEILTRLLPHKNHLQTVGMLCGDGEAEALRETFWRTGVVRCCAGGDMSRFSALLPHDGERPLRRYTKIVAAD